jgi:hypothetical protein
MKVILFAWLNCKPKHLQKIESWWKAKNINPVSVFSPPQNLFFPYWLGRPAGARTAKLLTDESESELGKKQNLFMHAFSGQASNHTLVSAILTCPRISVLHILITSNPAQ